MSVEQENPTVTAQWFHIPQLSSRHGVRAISACVSDVPGVRTVEARLDTRTLSVTGTADAAAVQTALRRAGYQAVILSHRPEPDGIAGNTAGATEVER
jgi:copper chaperone CopZ